MLKLPKINFGIRIATYPRPNGMTEKFLNKTIKTVHSQTYKNWTVYLIGDSYGPDLFKLIPSHDKIKVIDAPVDSERFHKKGRDLMLCGGINAINYGMDFMEKDGVQFYVSLDDDDIWYEDHLETLAKGYQNFPDAYFVYTRGLHIRMNRELPNINFQLDYNNLPPQAGQTLHSSVSWRLDKIKLRYLPHNILFGDEHMWIRMQSLFREKNWKFLHIPKCTMYHDGT